MGECFLPARGTVYNYQMKNSTGKGMYWIDTMPSGKGNYPILIKGVEISDVDLVGPMTLLNGFKALYSFGRDFGNAVIHGEVLLGPTASTATAMGDLINFFEAYRISKTNKPVNVSVPGGKAYKTFLTGLALGMPDVQYHTQSFAICGIIADPVGAQT